MDLSVREIKHRDAAVLIGHERIRVRDRETKILIGVLKRRDGSDLEKIEQCPGERLAVDVELLREREIQGSGHYCSLNVGLTGRRSFGSTFLSKFFCIVFENDREASIRKVAVAAPGFLTDKS